MSLGKLITNLQTALINEDEKDDKNYLSRFQLQGEKYLKYNEMRTNEIKPQFKLMENFSIINNNAVETKNNKEIQALIDLDKEYKKKLSDYSEQRQILMRDTNMYLNKMSSSENKLLGNNIRFDNGEIGYVTGEGVYKKYDSFDLYQNTIGKNGCPINYEQLNINRDGDKISTNPPLNLGTPMAWGQSCGNAGKNVYVINSEEPDEPTYVGCYKSSSENGLTYQSDMGSTSDVNSCKYRAFDKGNGVFAVGSGGKGTSKCYIGTNLDKAKSGGEAKIYKETWNTGGPFTDSTRAGLNNAGQLVITNNDNSEIEFYQNDFDPGGNSYYVENSDINPAAAVLYNDSHKRKLKSITLDSAVLAKKLPLPDLIKIDVQGAELDILKGAEETLKTVQHVILGLQMIEYNRGGPLHNEVIAYMSTQGFKCAGMFCDKGPDGDYHFVRR